MDTARNTAPLCLITGANSGLGKAMATALARQGMGIVMVCRNPETAEVARSEIQAASEGPPVEVLLADLSDLSEVRRVAEAFRARHDSLHVLINNAGLYLPKRHVTVDGLETMFAVNHMAPFLLTQLLEKPLTAARGARVVTVSSEGHRVGHLDFDDLQRERSFQAFRQYGATKLANILFTRELARRWADRGVVASCFHPGAVATGFAQDEPGLFGSLVKLGRPFLRSAEKGAETGIFLASQPEVPHAQGSYFIDRKPRRPSREARNDAVATRLWEASEQIAG
ncbi:MAG: SDR family oxidoreductase [Myxococcota bacterium]